MSAVSPWRKRLVIWARLSNIALQGQLVYRFNFFLNTFKYGWYIWLMVFVWLAVSRSNPDFSMTQTQVVQYYVLAAILFGFSNHYLDEVDFEIKQGSISRFLVKPVGTFHFYYVPALVRTLSETLVKVVVLTAAMWWFESLPQLNLAQIAVTAFLLLLVHFFSYNLHYVISLFSFWFQQVYSIRYSMGFIVRFLSGLLVPLSLLPLPAQTAIRWSPFPEYASTPIALLQNQLSWWQIEQRAIVLLFWTAVVLLVRNRVWREATHAYESTGI